MTCEKLKNVVVKCGGAQVAYGKSAICLKLFVFSRSLVVLSVLVLLHHVELLTDWIHPHLVWGHSMHRSAHHVVVWLHVHSASHVHLAELLRRHHHLLLHHGVLHVLLRVLSLVILFLLLHLLCLF